MSGESDWKTLQSTHPTKIKQIKELKLQQTPVEKASDFQFGTGGLISRVRSRFSPNMAEVPDKKTLQVLNNIKSEADWKEFLADLADYQAAGVDVKAIQEYFGK